ncbi:MAG: DUF2183 domain-containing protein [Rhodothermia bacterium]|nr:DUF2183 domain-containing protein [Rhodothermia bacterium]
MSFITDTIFRAGAALEERVDRWRYARHRRSRKRRAVIVPYRGFGTSDEIYLKGRVLDEKRIPPASDEHRLWHNLRAMYRRFESDEVPYARIAAFVEGHRVEVEADDEGYFDLRIPVGQDGNIVRSDHAWYPVNLSLVDPAPATDAPPTTAAALIPHPDASFGVITDVDDTILITNAARRLQMLRTTLFGNARTRLPFPGVADLYRALHQGTGEAPNPVFYLSSSPWNLYDFLAEFMDIHQLPKGPLFLRDLGIDRTKFFKTSHESHKLAQIRRLMMTFPNLPFILIGDSGQHDPEIYRMAVEHFPGRIPAVYIRDVTTRGRDQEVRDLARSVRDYGGDMVLARDSGAVAEHAAQHGFVDPKTAENLIEGPR